MSKLNISADLSLPLDFVTQTQAILAKRGVGKSYTASVQAEELLKAGQQVVVIDPTGAWFGLKSSADGKHAGFPMPSGQDLINHWMGRVGHAHREILRVLIETGRPMSKEEIAEKTESARGGPYSPDGGGFLNPLSELRTLELISGSSQIRLCEELQEAAA